MRYVITGEWSRNTLLRLIVALFLGYMLLFVVSSALLYFTRMGLDPDSVVQYFLGDPGQEFGRPPRPYASLVETSHMHLFAMGMLVMVLTHLLLFVPIKPAVKGWLVLLSFVGSIASELSNWLVRFVHPVFAYLKVGSFLLMELSLSVLVVLLAVYVARPTRNGYRDTENRRRPQGGASMASPHD